MEMTTVLIYGTIGALLCLIVGAMLGYARCESQQLLGNALQREHLQACDAKWRELLTDAKSQATLYKDRWEFSDEYRDALVKVMSALGIWDFSKHGGNPGMMLAIMMLHVADQAIDPTINQKAKNLHTAGVRKGAKMGRKQMQKLMQKSIDNQAATIDGLSHELFRANGKRQLHREAVLNVLDDKVALPSVRKSIKQAIIEETGRLYLVAAKKGN
jgi:hypothetical protein